jgi:hypothetical protein
MTDAAAVGTTAPADTDLPFHGRESEALQDDAAHLEG